MSKLATQAELVKLSSTLEVESERLSFLADVPAEQLRALRVAVYEVLYRDDRELFARMARVFRRLPPRVMVVLAERVFGPQLTARMAAELPSQRAAEVALRASIPFLADTCAHLDPRRNHDVIRRLPVERVAPIALELIGRGDYITMSRFVDFLSDEAIQAVIDAIPDEEALLRVSFFMGSKNRLDHVIRMLSPQRMNALVRLVADESRDLLAPFLSLVVHASFGLKRELGDLVAEQDEAVIDRYVRAAHEQDMWPDVLPAVAAMSPTAREKVVNLPVLREPEVQERILHAADEHGLWGIVLPMVHIMDDANREAVASLLATMPAATFERAANAALMGEHWEPLLDLIRRGQAGTQERFAHTVRRLGEVDPDLFARLARRARELGMAAALDTAARSADERVA
jgi:hypothetical protein